MAWWTRPTCMDPPAVCNLPLLSIPLLSPSLTLLPSSLPPRCLWGQPDSQAGRSPSPYLIKTYIINLINTAPWGPWNPWKFVNLDSINWMHKSFTPTFTVPNWLSAAAQYRAENEIIGFRLQWMAITESPFASHSAYTNIVLSFTLFHL